MGGALKSDPDLIVTDKNGQKWTVGIPWYCHIAGINYHKPAVEKIIDKLGGFPVSLDVELDKNNLYDACAVKFSYDGQSIGWVPQQFSLAIHKLVGQNVEAYWFAEVFNIRRYKDGHYSAWVCIERWGAGREDYYRDMAIDRIVDVEDGDRSDYRIMVNL
jgi:hypothetical protein